MLADVFESFRDVCLKPENYALDPAHYVSAPQLSWDAMLKCTGVVLEQIADPEMYRMIDSGMRGGVCVILQRYAKANNPYMGAQYDPAQPISYIVYDDMNNLYGYAMSKPLPYGAFEWVDLEQRKFTEGFWEYLSEDDETGYILDCDLEYPEAIHSAHNDYPLAPEKMLINKEMLSEKQKEIQAAYAPYRGGRSIKLVPNLMGKRRYIIHSANLRYYLEKGMKVTKLYAVIRFKQSAWLKPYIEKNQQLRAHAHNDFEKDFFKLMNNAIYGKTCENQKKRTNIRLVNTQKMCNKLRNKPHLLRWRQFGNDVAAIELKKVKLLIDKPFYVGFSVLELSKLAMYR